MAIKVYEVMEKHPIYVSDKDFITYARQLMRDHHHRTLPVIDRKNRVLGIITEQDVLNITSTKSNITVKGFITETPAISEDMDIKQAARIMTDAGLTRVPVIASTDNHIPRGIISIVDIFNNLDASDIPDRMVGEIMSRDIKTCTIDDLIAKIWINMIREGYSGYPVVDKHNHPIGMLTRHDIIKSGGIRIEREDNHGTRMGTSSKVARIMSTPPFTITPEVSIRSAIEMMIRKDVGRLCVVDSDVLVGIIDRHDIVRAYAEEGT